jgi:hypothetical protein
MSSPGASCSATDDDQGRYVTASATVLLARNPRGYSFTGASQDGPFWARGRADMAGGGAHRSGCLAKKASRSP